MKIIYLLLGGLLSLISCGNHNNPTAPEDNNNSMYFPSNIDTNWATIPINQLNWNANAIQDLKNYLAEKNTKSFIMLVDGKIAMEEYFDGQTKIDDWEWNSAGKSIISTLIGIAQQEHILNINDKVSDYLGKGWTNMPIEKENLITIKNLLTMTSGIDDTKQLMIKSNLNYVADAGNRWAYSNVFQKLIDVISKATNEDYETYFGNKLKNKIGMDGYWNFGLIFTIYHSTARSMARFGLLALNIGKWQNEQIIDKDYFTESINSSQNINPSYGYLWWLNGKSKYMVPADQTVYDGYLIPNAPYDMFAAMGANDQRLYIVPSKKLVIVRMGNAANPSNPKFAVSGFDNELWAKINKIIN